MNKIISFLNLYPLPNLPPRGKECLIQPFPLGGNGKGGYLIPSFKLIYTIIFKITQFKQSAGGFSNINMNIHTDFLLNSIF
jgi:hypothetical protein